MYRSLKNEKRIRKMKRVHDCVSNCTRSKRPRLQDPLFFNKSNQITVSATHIYNYMNNDTLVDWLKLTNNFIKKQRFNNTKHTESFNEFIMKRGIEFEEELIKYINTELQPVVTVSKLINNETIQKTKELMSQGIPIIHSAPVKNSYTNTQGIIDLLVRSDCLSNLIDEDPLTLAEKTIPSPKLGKPYHYIVIDIKFSTLPLRADGIHLLNSGSYPAYKAQCLIYTQAIGHIQGFTAPHAFIMGRRWKYSKSGAINRNYTCLNRLGKIDYEGVDKDYKLKTKNAIKWVRDVRKNGSNWTINPPSRKELYPNMCVDSGIWNTEKEKIADELGEITQIWNVQEKHRNKALGQGITSWRDKKCTTETLGIQGQRTTIIDAIMKINRQDEVNIFPNKIKSNLYNWKQKTNELYVDFETLSDIFNDFNNLPEQKTTDMIFMIGVGWEENGKWSYKNFICNSPTYNEEYRIMNEFAQFVADRGYPKLYHWVAEQRFWTTAENRQFDLAHDEIDIERKDHISDNWKVNEWLDLADLFRSEPIVIKGCFKFGLKNIAKCMYKHGMISSNIESSCDNGMSAMINAWKAYKDQENPVSSETMKDIAKYNEYDVRVLWEILSFLRKNHT